MEDAKFSELFLKDFFTYISRNEAIYSFLKIKNEQKGHYCLGVLEQGRGHK